MALPPHESPAVPFFHVRCHMLNGVWGDSFCRERRTAFFRRRDPFARILDVIPLLPSASRRNSTTSHAAAAHHILFLKPPPERMRRFLFIQDFRLQLCQSRSISLSTDWFSSMSASLVNALGLYSIGLTGPFSEVPFPRVARIKCVVRSHVGFDIFVSPWNSQHMISANVWKSATYLMDPCSFILRPGNLNARSIVFTCSSTWNGILSCFPSWI